MRSVHGNIMVIKSDCLGYVCDVIERDLYFVERILVRCRVFFGPIVMRWETDNHHHSYFEDDQHWRHPLMVNPVILPLDESYISFESW